MKLPPEEEFHAHRSLAKSYFILANYRAAKEHASLAQRLRPDDELQKIWLASRDTLDATPGRRLRDDRVRSVQETGEPTTAKGASSPATAEAAPTPAATEAKNPEAKPAPAVPAAEAEAATKTPAAAEPPAAANGDATAGAVPALEHVVAPGDTLAALAEKYYEDANQWHRIFEANQPQIGENYALKPGSKLRIPQPTPRPGAPETPKPEEAGKPPAAEAPEKSEEPKPQACDSNREELTVEVVRLRSALLVAEEAIRSGHEQLAQRDHALARLLAWKANAVEQEQAGRARDAALARRLRDSVAAAEREADEAIRHGAALLTPATGAGPAVASAENPAATADFSLSGPQMDRLRAVLETVRKEQARLAGEVVTRDQRIAELTSQVQALSREVATCTQLRGENARLRSEVREKDQQLAGLRETLTEREVALAQLRRESGVQGASINLSAGQRRAETEKAGQGRLERAPRTVAAPATVDADESSLTEERPRARGRRTQDERRSPDALSRAPEAQQPAAPRAAAPQAGSSNTPAPPPPGASRGPSPTEDLDASSIVETLLTLSGAR
ncbi:MAG: LysM peptidoglycan-binding domain-containing protein [Planctomycetes bacterium]|nr:LysM peptidoglycan-binding domain-containing protein [Planctomycetota bacterium]